ncbi:MAG: AAA family ATPase [Patescibacteria group bacterium]
MFKKVPKLKKFGIFRNFSWSSDTPDFARFNLIYGWNKSGKTTLSRIFSACEKKTTDFVQYPKDKDDNLGEFEITTTSGTTIKHSDCQNGTKQIRVFNKDFIEDNVSFDPLSPSNPIVYVSEEDIESNKKLKELREKVTSLSQKLEFAQKDRKKSEKAEDDFRISTARTVKDIVGNLKVNDKYRDYDKSSVKTAIENIGIDQFTKFSDDNFRKKKKLIGSDPLQSQSLFSKYKISFEFNGTTLSSFSDIHNELSKLLKRQVVAETIDRFKIDPTLNKWAQHGFELHKTKDEKKKCLFCQNEFSEGFLESLSKHFSNDYEKLQEDITSFITELSPFKREKVAEKNPELYIDLQSGYKDGAKKLNGVVSDLNAWIDAATQKLSEKHSSPLSTVDSPKSPKDFKEFYDKAIDELNNAIISHNSKVENHEQEVKTAKEQLEHHLIAVATKEQDYLKMKSEYDSSVGDEQKAKDGVDENNKQISNLEKETSNIGKAIQKINKHLEEFFGRKEIQLELDDSKKGYVIKRDDDIAYNLSESEKNAIAFSYFIVKTQERGFKIKEGIIVVDDPISSFDSNFIYHCFLLIKNNFKEAEQLIVLTHNFEFFNLVKDWFEQKNRKVESDNKKITNEAGKKPIPSEFFMIENIVENEKRCASIVPLEETLRKFKSEYHFLFSRLNQFITKGSPDYADFYTIGNIARRFLEIYINFKIPTTGDLQSKVDQLDTQTVSETEKHKVYKLIQEFSHGLDLASTIEHKDKSEIQGAIKVLMKMVEESDRKHFESLKSNL